MRDLIAFEERLEYNNEHLVLSFFTEFNFLTFAIYISSFQINTPLSYLLFSFNCS